MKRIVMTWEQLRSLCSLLEATGNPLMNEIIYLPEKYEWMREYLESDQMIDYLSTGFNFLSPIASDMDFGYGYTTTRFIIINKISWALATAGNWIRCHWRAFRNAVYLALYNDGIQFPTLEEFKSEWGRECAEFEEHYFTSPDNMYLQNVR